MPNKQVHFLKSVHVQDFCKLVDLRIKVGTFKAVPVLLSPKNTVQGPKLLSLAQLNFWNQSKSLHVTTEHAFH